MCFDLPLSSLNRFQAESINDLENYLVAKSLHSTAKKEEGIHFSKSATNESFSQTGSKSPLDLLNEFNNMQKVQEKEEAKLEVCKNLEVEAFSLIAQNENDTYITQSSSMSHNSGKPVQIKESHIYKVPSVQSLALDQPN